MPAALFADHEHTQTGLIFKQLAFFNDPKRNHLAIHFPHENLPPLQIFGQVLEEPLVILLNQLMVVWRSLCQRKAGSGWRKVRWSLKDSILNEDGFLMIERTGQKKRIASGHIGFLG